MSAWEMTEKDEKRPRTDDNDPKKRETQRDFMPAFPAPKSYPGTAAMPRENSEKNSNCCSTRVKVTIFILIIIAVILTLCGCVAYLKLELDAMKEERTKPSDYDEPLQASARQDRDRGYQEYTDVDDYDEDETYTFTMAYDPTEAGWKVKAEPEPEYTDVDDYDEDETHTPTVAYDPTEAAWKVKAEPEPEPEYTDVDDYDVEEAYTPTIAYAGAGRKVKAEPEPHNTADWQEEIYDTDSYDSTEASSKGKPEPEPTPHLMRKIKTVKPPKTSKSVTTTQAEGRITAPRTTHKKHKTSNGYTTRKKRDPKMNDFKTVTISKKKWSKVTEKPTTATRKPRKKSFVDPKITTRKQTTKKLIKKSTASQQTVRPASQRKATRVPVATTKTQKSGTPTTTKVKVSVRPTSGRKATRAPVATTKTQKPITPNTRKFKVSRRVTDKTPTTAHQKGSTVAIIEPVSTTFFTSTNRDQKSIDFQCTEFEFRCKSSECIPKFKRCDGKIDCNEEPTDEINCTCRERHSNKQCDGFYDCRDGSDESNCSFCTGLTECGVGNCITSEQMCNGINDCLTRNDEKYCFKLSENFDQNLIVTYKKSGYLMHRVRNRWHPVCYTGTVRDRVSRLPKERRIIQELCSTYTGVSFPGVEADLVPISDLEFNFDNFNFTTLYENTAAITKDCSSGMMVHVDCPDILCPTENANPIQQRFGDILEPSNHGYWPWHALVYRNGVLVCGATVLSETFLVTTAECVENPQNDYLEIIIGSVRHGSNSPYDTRHLVSSVAIHESYDPNDPLNNLAIINVLNKIEYSTIIQNLCLPVNISQSPKSGELCRTVGWGHHQLSFADQLWSSQVILSDVCEDDSKICASLRKGCAEQKGSAIFCQVEEFRKGLWYLAGIVSESSTCNTTTSPRGTYLKINPYLNWIKEVLSTDEEGIKTEDNCPGIVCQAFNGRTCLPNSSACDNNLDCVDATDELNCSS